MILIAVTVVTISDGINLTAANEVAVEVGTETVKSTAVVTTTETQSVVAQSAAESREIVRLEDMNESEAGVHPAGRGKMTVVHGVSTGTSSFFQPS